MGSGRLSPGDSDSSRAPETGVIPPMLIDTSKTVVPLNSIETVSSWFARTMHPFLLPETSSSQQLAGHVLRASRQRTPSSQDCG